MIKQKCHSTVSCNRIAEALVQLGQNCSFQLTEMSSILEDDDNSFEIDANVIFKQEAGQLTTVKDLEDGLNRFGYSKDDRISRRDIVLIYNQIKKAMESEIFNLANSSKYAEAKALRATLTNLRNEFDQMQIGGVQTTRREQVEMFSKASHEITNELKRTQAKQVRELDNFFEHQRSTHELYNNIETNKLEQTISLIPHPHVRYSKRLIELFKAEYNLNKLKQYDEAIKVRRMIDKILPKEEQAFHENFEKSLENRRKKLQHDQQVDQVRFDEKMKKLEWDELRRRELAMNV